MVPVSKTYELWKKYHDTFGHMGVAKMEALLRRAFYWPGMTTYLQEWASQCANIHPTEKGLGGKGTFGAYSDIISFGKCFD